MKIRTGFVSNSSSSSFVIHLTDDKITRMWCTEKIQNAAAIVLFKCLTDPSFEFETRKFSDISKDKITDIETKYGFIDSGGCTGWDISVSGNTIMLFTSMTNFDMYEFVVNECKGLYKEITDLDNS